MLLVEKKGFGLTPHEVRGLAYDYAEANDIENNFSKDRKAAGQDWLYGFLSRHNDLSLRKPEGISAQRAWGMNRAKVLAYFDILQETILKYGLKAEHIYNVDETGLTEVHDQPKVIARKGKKNIAGRTSDERGTTTAVLFCANAIGEYVPPFIIFKGVRNNAALSKGARFGSIIKLSWIDETLFMDWMKHFDLQRKKTNDGATFWMDMLCISVLNA